MSDTRRQAEAFFACLAANDAVAHLHQFLMGLDAGRGLGLFVRVGADVLSLARAEPALSSS